VRPLSLDHLTVIDASPLELIEAAAAGGFDHVGLRIVQPLAAAEVADVIGQPALQRDLKAAMAATGVSVQLIESIWLGPDADPPSLEPALATGAELGARFVLVAGNDPERARLTGNLDRLASLANNYGLEIAFEFMPFTQVRRYEDATAIKREIGRDNLRLLVDALHLSRSGRDFHKLEPFDSSIVSYVHLCDARGAISASSDSLRAEARLDRYDPGEGELPLDAFLDAMPADAHLGIEVPCNRYAGLPPVERGRIAGRTARNWLKRHDARQAAAGH
jgi:sugar phosphate isomerase/epimerase